MRKTIVPRFIIYTKEERRRVYIKPKTRIRHSKRGIFRKIANVPWDTRDVLCPLYYTRRTGRDESKKREETAMRLQTRSRATAAVVTYAGNGWIERRRRFASRFTATTKYPWLGVIIDFTASPVDRQTRLVLARVSRIELTERANDIPASTRRISFRCFIDSTLAGLAPFPPCAGNPSLSLYLSLSAVRPTSTIRSTSGRRLSLLTQPSDRDGVLVVNNASYLNCREVWTATGAPDTLPRYDHKRFEFMSSPVGELLLTPIPLPPPSLVDPFSLRQRSFERTVANWPTEIVQPVEAESRKIYRLANFFFFFQSLGVADFRICVLIFMNSWAD